MQEDQQMLDNRLFGFVASRIPFRVLFGELLLVVEAITDTLNHIYSQMLQYNTSF